MPEHGIFPRKFNVYAQSDVVLARRTAKEMAAVIGFDKTACEEISITVSEMTTNLVKHAGGGTLSISLIEGDNRGIEVETLDRGPGVTDIEIVAADGYSTSGSLGAGLGAVNRLMSELEVSSVGTPNIRTRIVARKWLMEKKSIPEKCPLDIAASSRPRLGTYMNGDAFIIKKWEGNALVGVIDGLGQKWSPDFGQGVKVDSVLLWRSLEPCQSVVIFRPGSVPRSPWRRSEARRQSPNCLPGTMSTPI